VAVGDVDSEIGARYIQLTEDGTSAIVKGDLCVVRAGKVHDAQNATDQGPYVVAVEAIAKSGTGRCLIEGIVELAEDNVGNISLGWLVKPGTTTKTKIQKARATDFSSNYVQSDALQLSLIVGTAYEAITKASYGRILLGYRAGNSA
jgi:hypothetical protein